MRSGSSSGRKTTTRPLGDGPSERAAFQTFGVQYQTRTVPEENLQAIARFVGEHEQETGSRLLLKSLFHQAVEAIETLAAIDRPQGKKHPGGRR